MGIAVQAGKPGLMTPAQITGATGGTFKDANGNQFNIQAEGSGRLEQRRFKVVASGWVKLPAGTYTATVVSSIYAVAGGALWTAGSGNVIAALSSLSVTQAAGTAVTVPFSVQADLEGDSTSGTLQGTKGGFQSNALTAAAAITNPPTGIVFGPDTYEPSALGTSANASEPPLQFAAGVTLTNGQTGAIANLGTFYLAYD